jgi:hypothetical protein
MTTNCSSPRLHRNRVDLQTGIPIRITTEWFSASGRIQAPPRANSRYFQYRILVNTANRVKQHGRGPSCYRTSRADESIPNPHHRAKGEPRELSIWLTCCSSLVRGSWTGLCNDRLTSSSSHHDRAGEDGCMVRLDHLDRSTGTARRSYPLETFSGWVTSILPFRGIRPTSIWRTITPT